MILLTLSLVILVILGWNSHYKIKKHSVAEISFPLGKGNYTILQGGCCPLGNLTHFFNPGSRYGLDIVKFSLWGTMFKWTVPLQPEQFLIYGDSVFSPCRGTITWVVSTVPDHPSFVPDKVNSAGNYIIIKQDSIKICLSHLMQNSIVVKTGELVETGDFIGLVGNSGYSFIPHLHIHAINGGDSNTMLQGTPTTINFQNYPIEINSIIISREKLFTVIF